MAANSQLNPGGPSPETMVGQSKAIFPRLVATAAGLGYLPLMPGTFGALAGVGLYVLAILGTAYFGAGHRGMALGNASTPAPSASGLWIAAAITILVSGAGVWAAGWEERASRRKDPQHVVIDEVSGQLIAYAAALAPLNWKYCLAGFILFRAFDIAKPFPVRQAESLPGGWGIMADDWLAGLYAALGLWILRWAGM
jgi:phosphatidylglycerophosphatase A